MGDQSFLAVSHIAAFHETLGAVCCAVSLCVCELSLVPFITSSLPGRELYNGRSLSYNPSSSSSTPPLMAEWLQLTSRPCARECSLLLLATPRCASKAPHVGLGVGFGLRPKSDMVRNSETPKPRSFGKFR